MSRTVPPVLPEWLINAAFQLDPKVRGVALGFAASAWVAGYGAGFDAAVATADPEIWVTTENIRSSSYTHGGERP